MDQEMIGRVAKKVYYHYIRGTDHEARLTVEDLAHAGVVGYIEAEDKFCEKKSVGDPKLFYLQRVRWRMLDLVRTQALVRMPQQPYDKLKELLAAKRDLEQGAESVSPRHLADKLGWQESEVQALLASVPKVFSADHRRDITGEQGESLLDSLPSSSQRAPQLDQELRREISRLIQHCLERLGNSRQRLILMARYLEDMRLKDLAVRFSCTAQAVHYQEQQALGKMRSCLEHNGWQWDGSEGALF